MYNLEVAQDHTFTVGQGQWVVHNCTLTNLATQATQDEIDAANHVASIKNNPGDTVILRDPVGPRFADGGTSDLVVNGTTYDIYTPETSNINNIYRTMANKHGQANGIVLNLSKTSLTAADFPDVLLRLQSKLRSQGSIVNIQDVIVYDP